MALIEDIINALVNNEESLVAALLKTKVLASRIGNQELLEWTNKELAGYHSEDDLPKYRKHYGVVKGNYNIGFHNYQNHTLAILNLPNNIQDALTRMHLYQGISSLESMKGSDESSTLSRAVPPEVGSLITRKYQEMGNQYFNLQEAQTVASSSIISQTLGAIRSNLLDFMLRIESEMGIESTIKDLKSRPETVQEIFNSTIYTTGDGNLINTGNRNTIKSTVKIKKGDTSELFQHLRDIGIGDSDISELSEFIERDSPDISNKRFGPKLNSWIQRMIAKALDGSWNVGIGAAGNLLAQAFMNYYGM